MSKVQETADNKPSISPEARRRITSKLRVKRISHPKRKNEAEGSYSLRKPPVNVLELFAATSRDLELLRQKLQLRSLADTSDRHGDLQVALSAARRIEAALQALIDAEEA